MKDSTYKTLRAIIMDAAEDEGALMQKAKGSGASKDFVTEAQLQIAIQIAKLRGHLASIALVADDE